MNTMKNYLNSQLLEEALFAVADGYCVINLTQGIVPGVMYQVVDGQKYNLNEQLGIPEDADLQSLVDAWALTIPEEGLDDFRNEFNRERLLKRFSDGERHISFEYWTRTATFEPMLAEDHMAMFQDAKTGDVIAVNYVIDRAKQDRLKNKQTKLIEQNNRLESLLNTEREYSGLLSAFSKIYEELYELNLKSGTYHEVFADNKMQKYSDENEHTIDDNKEATIKTMSIEYQDMMNAFLDINTLYKRLEDTDSIAVEFRMQSGEWRRGRFIVRNRDENGDAESVFYVIENIDKEKSIEIRYKDEIEEKSRALSGLSLDYTIAFLLNLDTDKYKILFTQETNNAKARSEILYFSEYVNRYADMFVLPEFRESFKQEICSEGIRKQFETKGEYHYTFETLPNEAGLSNFQAHIVKEYDEKGHYAILGFRSVDETVKKERLYKKDLMEKSIQLETEKRANQSKSSFLARMSHEMRTPINGIVGLLKINENHQDDYNLIMENQKKMRVSAEHLLNLINDVLQMSKIEDGSVMLEREAVYFEDLADEIATIIEPRAADNGIEMCFSRVNDNKQPMIICSPVHLRQIFLNIYENCIKYNSENGKIFTEVDFSENAGKCTYYWTIRDTGIGMDEEYKERIFKPFTQESTEVSSTYKGVGLGMSIVKGLIDEMGGSISVDSEQGNGTKFRISITFDVADETVWADDNADKDEEDTNIEGLMILLVEDNELNAEITKVLLEDAGAKVAVAKDGREGLEFWNDMPEDTFDVILMDLMMPLMGGLEASRRIRGSSRADSKKVPIIAMTANSFVEDKVKCRKSGMNAHLSKPIDIEVVKKTIRKCLNKAN